MHIERDLIKFQRKVVHSTKGDVKEQRLTHLICRSHISEAEAHRCFAEENGSSFYVTGIELRHLSCCHFKHSTVLLGNLLPCRIRMSINLLLTCRQIHREACFIPYSTNTFSFDVPRNLRAFIHLLIQRGVDVNRAVRSLHVDLAHINHDLHAWRQAFNAVMQHMTLLKTIYITVDQRPGWSVNADYRQKLLSMEPVLDCLATLGKNYPSKSIMIVLGDQNFAISSHNIGLMSRCWTLREKRDWVGMVKSAIEQT